MKRAVAAAVAVVALALSMGAKGCGTGNDGSGSATVRCHSLHPFDDCGPGGQYGWRQIGTHHGIPIWVPAD